MARPATGRRAPAIIAWTSGTVAAALLVGGAVLAQGYDAEDVPTIETSVWVARDNGDYAKVNTDVGEIETVNRAEGLAGIAQTGPAAFAFGSGWQRFWAIDPADPVDIESDAGTAESPAGEGSEVPTGTTGAVANGQWCAADEGRPAAQWRGRYVLFSGPTLAWARGAALAAGPDAAHAIDLLPDDAGTDYQASAAAISACGVVAAYSVEDGERRVRTYDVEQGRVLAATEIADPPTSPAGLQLSFVGDAWVLFQADADAPRIWIDGAGPYALPSGIGGSGLLQSPGPAADAVLIASSSGLVRVSMADGGVLEQVAAAGVAARPTAFGDRMAAAWLTSGSGALWVSDGRGIEPLAIDGGEFPQNTEVTPSLVTNGDRAVLLERSTGMMWSVPDGALIPLAQWSSDTPPEEGTVDVPDASDQEPPVAEDDAFGVRAGATAVLPVLFNDHDANQRDVLSIDPTSIEGLDPAFGTVSLVGADQTLVVQVAGGAPSASFSYRVSDGMATSQPATVTVSLRNEDSAPQWCGDYLAPAACHVDWPAPQIGVGGTGTFDVLKGWIDPEGDAIVIDTAVPEAGAPIVAMPTADGELAIAHDADGAPGQYKVQVTVVDAFGMRSAPKELVVTVQDPADFAFRGGAILGRPGETTQASVADYASGGSGSYRVVDVTDISPVLGRLAEPAWNEAAGTVSLRADEPGEYIVAVRAQDPVTRNEHTANLRYTVVAADADGVAVPPLTAYVRQGQDALIDVIGAVQNTTGRVLLVTSAVPGPTREGAVAVATAVVDDAIVQIRSLDSIVADSLGGRTDGPLGTVAVTLTDSTGAQYPGTISVFLVPPTEQRPVALPDTATVRAGEVVDIDALANDIAPRGERLALSPDVSTAGDDAGLAFASGRSLRYVAPSVPGTYTAFYYAYLESSPELLSRAQVTITVLPPGANRAPQAVDLEARTLAGRSIAIPVPVDSIDPDGDRVAISAVTQPGEDAPGSVMVGDDGRSLLFYAPEVNRQPRADAGTRPSGWQATFTYTVRDAAGETSTATVRVAVSTEDPADLAPIVFTDRVRVERPSASSAPVTVDPLLNDRDPASGSFALVASGAGAGAGDGAVNGLHILGRIVPNMPGIDADGTIAPDTPAQTANGLLDPATPTRNADGVEAFYADGRVRFTVTPETPPGSYSFLYTAESVATRSTAQGVIVLTVSDGEEPDRPSIDDTVVDIRTRALLETGGIDVLTGRVSWPTGDPSTLAPTLAIAPGAPAGFTAHPDGRISGRIPEAGAIVPFSVTGTDLSGAEFTSYGLLRIPAFADLRLRVTRIPDAVQETKSGEIDLNEVLGLGEGDRVEVDPDSSFAIHRPSTDPNFPASCALQPGGGATLRYTAGYSPGIGSDTCTIRARLVGQPDDAWSALVVPIPIAPLDPLAILTPITKTIPFIAGATEIDLAAELVTWTGGFAMPDGLVDTMRFTAPYAGGGFTVATSGDAWDPVLKVDVLPTTPGGTREVIPVTLTYPWPNSPDATPYSRTVNIVLYSGQPPPGGPVGARVSLHCDATAPEACRTQLVFPTDQQGQVNPSAANTSGASTALALVGLAGSAPSAECPGLGTVTVEGTAARLALAAAEDGKPPGGTCTVPFTVRDTLGRTGQGSIDIEVNGFPQKPRTPTTNAVAEDRVTIDIVLGDATRAHPAVTAVRLYENGALVPNQQCAPLDAGAYQCEVTGLVNGEHHFFAARTVNAFAGAERESALSGVLETWAFLAPEFTLDPTYQDAVFREGSTGASAGVVRLHQMCLAHNAADGGDPSKRSRILLTADRGSLSQSQLDTDASGCTSGDIDVTVSGATGPVQLTLTPQSGEAAPTVGTGTATASRGGSRTITPTVRGLPSVGAVVLPADAGESATFTVSSNGTTAQSRNSADGLADVHVLAWRTGTAAPVCTSVNDPTPPPEVVVGANRLAVSLSPGAVDGGSSGSFSIGDGPGELVRNEQYSFKTCASWGYGIAETPAAQVTSRWLFHHPGAPTAADPTYEPKSADMSLYESFTDGDAPVFRWTLPDDPPTNHAAADFESGRSALQASEPPPSGAAWEVRYSASASGPWSTAATATSITNALITSQLRTVYAKYCFTAGGEDVCSTTAAAVGPVPGVTPVGIEFGTTGELRLPAKSLCVAELGDGYPGGPNQRVIASGQTRAEQNVDAGAQAASDAARDATWNALWNGNAAFRTWADSGHQRGHDVDGDDVDPGFDDQMVDAYLAGYGGHQGFNPAYDAWVSAHPVGPGYSSGQQAADATAAGRQSGHDAAVAMAGDRAAADGAAADAAYRTAAATNGTPEHTAAENARVAGEQDMYAQIDATDPAPTSTGPSTTGFSSAPIASGPAVTIVGDAGARRFSSWTFDYGPGHATATSTGGYVLDAIRSSTVATYTCG